MKKWGIVLALIICTLFVVSCSNQTADIPLTPQITINPTNSPTPTSTPPPLLLQALSVHFIDVGQGDAILVDLGQTEILIDGGDGVRSIVPYLKNFVDGSLEVMVATHPHADHIGGLPAILGAYQVQQIWHDGEQASTKIYATFMSGAQAEGAAVCIGKRGDKIAAGELSLAVLSPRTLSGDPNNDSLVLNLSYGKVDFLFMGDAGINAEKTMLVASDMPVPDIDVLKVGHHASRSGSSPDFLSIIKPEMAVYMAGVGNRYGHPHPETLTNLAAVGAKVYGTDVCGTIVVSTDGKSYFIKTEK